MGNKEFQRDEIKVGIESGRIDINEQGARYI